MSFVVTSFLFPPSNVVLCRGRVDEPLLRICWWGLCQRLQGMGSSFPPRRRLRALFWGWMCHRRIRAVQSCPRRWLFCLRSLWAGYLMVVGGCDRCSFDRRCWRRWCPRSFQYPLESFLLSNLECWLRWQGHQCEGSWVAVHLPQRAWWGIETTVFFCKVLLA